MNYQAYDIGNHFSEFAGVDSVDYSFYPNKELQWKWLRIYLQTYHQTENISDDMIEELYIQVNQFALAAHLLWGIWALIQAEHSRINFDFIQ
ncbi:easily shocked [Carabus blaptoides fortunei]